MTQERLAALLDAYGADPARWPEGERSALALADRGTADLQRRLADAVELDGWLADYRLASPGLDLVQGLVGAVGPARSATAFPRRRISGWWPRAALALTGVAGAVAGAAVVAIVQPDPAPAAAAGWQRGGTAFGDRAAEWSDE